MKLKLLHNITIHPSWEGFLNDETLSRLAEVEKRLFKTEFTPREDKVLRFLSVPLNTIRIIILGQDPYPRPGAATGRAFEVGNLRSWSEPFNNISVKNILRAVYRAYTGEIIKYNLLKTKLDNEFPVLPPPKLFTSWENQGVLLLNTWFTCQPGKPGSHRMIWEEFAKNLLGFIHSHHKGIIWFLWGNSAHNSVAHLDIGNAVKTLHPMMCFDKPGRTNDFLYGETNCFETCKNLVNWTGYEMKESPKPGSLLF